MTLSSFSEEIQFCGLFAACHGSNKFKNKNDMNFGMLVKVWSFTELKNENEVLIEIESFYDWHTQRNH